MHKLLTSFVALASLVLLLFSGHLVMASEITPYEVLRKEGNYEIRRYENMVLATVAAQSDAQRNSAFRSLFRYISGDNGKNEKIAMTAPVFMDYDDDNLSTMSFVLPHNMPLDQAPLPDNNLISLSETGETVFAALRFSGRLTPKKIIEKKKALAKWLSSKDIQVNGPVSAAGYNAPYVPPFMRRNEVLAPVEYTSIMISSESNTSSK